eukprot:2869930-Rhodomonas_salina.2
MHKLLDINFNEPKTLEDIRLKATLVEQVNQTLLNLWCGAPTLAQQYQDLAEETEESETGESETGESKPTQPAGPFQDQLRNDVWLLLASQMMENYEQLVDIDMLEPNPANQNEAMRNHRLKPFWLDSEQKEMDGLWRRWCFK